MCLWGVGGDCASSLKGFVYLRVKVFCSRLGVASVKICILCSGQDLFKDFFGLFTIYFMTPY